MITSGLSVIERAIVDYIDARGEREWSTFKDVGGREEAEWFVKTGDGPPAISITGMAAAVVHALRREGIAV